MTTIKSANKPYTHEGVVCGTSFRFVRPLDDDETTAADDDEGAMPFSALSTA